MPLRTGWKAATIASSGTSSDEVNLGLDCDFIMIILPTLDSCTIKIQVAESESGTFQDLGSNVTTDTTTGAYSTTFVLGGYQYIKVVSSATQTVERLIRVNGIKT